jgi:hypothetical protein
MHCHKLAIFFTLVALVGWGSIQKTYARSEATTCALIDVSGFETLSDGTRVENGRTEREKIQIINLVSSARARLARTFGMPRAKPIIIFHQSTKTFWSSALATHGSTSFIGTRACVFIGPYGGTIDVVAHELMHAEMFERIGVWARATQIPTWFDEGLAMQVDYRALYVLSKTMHADTTFVRKLDAADQFFVSDPKVRIFHYAAAKREVSQMLSAKGTRNLYAMLDRIAAGEPFVRVFDN